MQKQNNHSASDDEKIVEKAVQLSLIEVVIGSTLHMLHIPLSGHILSLNQGFLLCRYTRYCDQRAEAAKTVIEVSCVASIMKALAPVGKKLGPMISISMQGFLFACGSLLAGLGLGGRILSMLMLSLWAFVQPLVTYYVIYGSDLTHAIQYYVNKQSFVLDIIYILVATKFLLAALIPVAMRYAKESTWQHYEEKIFNFSNQRSIPVKKLNQPAWLASLRDLMRPAFLLSLALMVVYFSFAGETQIAIIWKSLRALAIAFVIFYLARSPIFLSCLEAVAKRNKFLKRIYELSAKAISKISEQK